MPDNCVQLSPSLSWVHSRRIIVIQTEQSAAAMSRKIVQHPFRWERPSVLWNLTNASTVAALFAAVAATLPSRQLGLVSAYFAKSSRTLICDRVLFATCGLFSGILTHKLLDLLRLRILKALFQYHGWVTHPKSTKTKVRTYCLVSYRKHDKSTYGAYVWFNATQCWCCLGIFLQHLTSDLQRHAPWFSMRTYG